MSSLSNKTVINSATLFETLGQVNITAFLDKWGPEEVIHVYDPETNMQGILVIDNTALGPGKGGIRISPTIKPSEIFQLARTMTWMCAFANVPFGGAKTGIKADPYKTDTIKLVQAIAKMLSPLIPSRYIAGPDLNCGEMEIASFVETIGNLQSATGKPEWMGGITHELGAAGIGVGLALEAGLKILHEHLNLPENLSETRVVIQGFGTVGLGIAKFLASKKAAIVAINDFWGTLYKPDGIDISIAERYFRSMTEECSIKNYPDGETLERDDIIKIDCDIFIPCAIGGVINERSCSLIKAKYIAEGTSNVMTAAAEQQLFRNGVFVLPDILTSAGNEICSYAEHKKMGSAEAFSLIESRTMKNAEMVIEKSLNSGLIPRKVAKDIAQQRVMDAMEGRHL